MHLVLQLIQLLFAETSSEKESLIKRDGLMNTEKYNQIWIHHLESI